MPAILQRALSVIGEFCKHAAYAVLEFFRRSSRMMSISRRTLLTLSAFLPWLITPLLMAGGLFLCFEGYEKAHEWFAGSEKSASETVKEIAQSSRELEDAKVAGAIRTELLENARHQRLQARLAACRGFHQVPQLDQEVHHVDRLRGDQAQRYGIGERHFGGIGAKVGHQARALSRVKRARARRARISVRVPARTSARNSRAKPAMQR